MHFDGLNDRVQSILAQQPIYRDEIEGRCEEFVEQWCQKSPEQLHACEPNAGENAVLTASHVQHFPEFWRSVDVHFWS